MSDEIEVVNTEQEFQDVPEVVIEGEAEVEQEESAAPADEDRTEDQVPDITGTEYVDPMTTSMDGIEDLPANEETQDLGSLAEENEDEFHDAQDNIKQTKIIEDVITEEQPSQLDTEENSGFAAEVQVDASTSEITEEVDAPVEEAPVPAAEEASPAEGAAPAEEAAPVEEAVAEEEISVGEPAPAPEETPAAEPVAEEATVTEEAKPEEPVEEAPAAEEAAPVEEAAAVEETPAEEPATEPEAAPAEEPVAEEPPVAEEKVEEAPPAEEPVVETEAEAPAAEEPVVDASPADEEPVVEESAPAEEAAPVEEQAAEEPSPVEEEKVEEPKEFELQAPPEGKPRTPNELDDKLAAEESAAAEEAAPEEVPPTPKSAVASEKTSVPPTPKSAVPSEKASVPPTPKSAVSATPKSAAVSTPKATGTPKSRKAFNFEDTPATPATPKSMKAFDSIPATPRTPRTPKNKDVESVPQTPRTPVVSVPPTPKTPVVAEVVEEPVEEKEATPVAEPEPTPEAEPEPEPVEEKEPTPVAEPEPEPVEEKEPSPVAEAEPEAVVEEEMVDASPAAAEEAALVEEAAEEPAPAEEAPEDAKEEVEEPKESVETEVFESKDEEPTETEAPRRRAQSPSPAPRERQPAPVQNYQAFDEDSHKTIPPPRLPTAESFSSWTPPDKSSYTALAPHAGDPGHKYRSQYTAASTYRPSTTYTSHFDDIVNTGAFSNALYSTSRLIERSRSRTRERRNAMRSQRSASNYFRYTSQMPTPTRSRDYSTPPSTAVSRAPSRAGSFASFMEYAGTKNYELSRTNSRSSVVHDNAVALSRSSSRGNVDLYLGGGRLSRVDSYVADMNTPYEYTAPASYERYRSSSVSRPIAYSPVTGYANPLYMDSDASRRNARYESVAVTPIGARSMYEGRIGHLERSLSREKINKERLRHEYSALSNKLDTAMRQMQLLRTSSYSNLHAHAPRTSVYQGYYPYF